MTAASIISCNSADGVEPADAKSSCIGIVMHAMQVAGAEMLVAELMRRYRDRYAFTVFCLDAVGALGEQLQAEGFDVVLLGRRSGLDWALPKRFARELRKRRISILHAHQYTPFFYAALARLRCRGVRLILTEHGRHFPDIVSARRRWGNRLLLSRAASAINACCEFSADALATNDGFSRRRIEVIRNGIDVSRYEPILDKARVRRELGFVGERRLIAMIGRFHPVKNHVMLIAAFAQVAAAQPDVDLLLAGDGPLLEACCRDVASRGLNDRVHFLGVRRDVPRLLQASDVFVLPSLSEAASLTLLEAMATGLPSVVTRVGGNPEIVRDDCEGRLVPRGDSPALTRATLEILGNPGVTVRYGNAARRRVCEVYRLEDSLARHVAVYDRVTAARRRSGEVGVVRN